MRALLRASWLSASALAASACLFPGFDDLVCESDCGGSSATTSPAGAGTQGGAGAGETGGTGGSAGGAAPTGGGGGGVPGCGPDGVLVSSNSPNVMPFCIDAFEVTWADYKPFVDGIELVATEDFEQWRGPSCAFQQQLRDVFTAEDDTTFFYIWDNLTSDDDLKPAVGMNWCEARIYCESKGRHLCGGLDGGPDDGSDSVSQWVAACSNFNAVDFSYGEPYQMAACYTEGCATPPDPPPVDYHSLWPAEPNACGNLAFPGIYNMNGNVSELVDNCQPDPRAEGDPSADICKPRGSDCNGTMFSVCTAVHNNDVQRKDRGNYIGFRCCWEPDG